MEKLVLIVDDDEDLGKLLQILLRQHGIQARHVTSVRELREAVVDVKPELVFLDNRLADGFGIDEVEYLKTICPSCRIILMTAEEWDDVRQNGGLEKIDGFLKKPFTVDSVEKVIRESA